MNASKLDYLLTIAEEIEITLGLKNKIVGKKVFIETIAGDIEVINAYGDLMQDVYRFVYSYGMSLTKYGIEERIKLANKT